jgi:putative ATP-dependent endonuclease of the OLD family
MRLSRVVIRNFRSFRHLDVPLSESTTCVIGENNAGKTNFLHAIRICIDAGLSSTFRSLLARDTHTGVDVSEPNQVLIGIEITDFSGKVNEEALVGAWQFEPKRARLIYRFRPKKDVRENLEAFEIAPGDLTLEDYHWEITAGGDPARDLAVIEWDEDVGTSIRFGDLQSFLVVYLQALRDVETDLRQYRGSPLARLVDAMEIAPTDQEKLVAILKEANDKIAADPCVDTIAKAIDDAFEKVTGPAFKMDIGLGLAEPSFQSVIRALRILLSNAAMTNFEPSSNGLGLNNILYVSILIEWFHKRVAQQKSAGQIILFEEPEAHLHPQLQLTLYKALAALPFQSILTTHSTHITANARLSSYIALTPGSGPGIESSALAEEAGLDKDEIADLERYLDATKSNLLFARKVMLVEGPAELFLIPAFLKQIKSIDLDRLGISVIPIYGVHFDVYAKLFTSEALPKKCAIVTDGDLSPDDAVEGLEGEDDLLARPDLKGLEGGFVKVFSCATTFERACVFANTLEMFARAADDVGAKTVAKKIREGLATIKKDKLTGDKEQAILNPLRDSILNTAKRFGKARFAQIAARHIDQATTMPKYIYDAAMWLSADDADE